MVISIIAVSLFITYSSIRMSSNLFIDTFSITNSKVMDQITQRFNSFTDSIVSASIEVETNGTIKQLLLEDHDNAVDKSTFYFYMTDEMDRIYSEVDPDDTNMVIMSNSNDIFNMNYIKWQINGDTLMNDPMIERIENSPNEIVYQYEDSELTNGVPMIIASKALKLKTGYIYGYLFFSLTEPDLKEFYESYTGVGNNVLLVTW